MFLIAQMMSSLMYYVPLKRRIQYLSFLAVENVKSFLGIALRVTVLSSVKAEYSSMRK